MTDLIDMESPHTQGSDELRQGQRMRVIVVLDLPADPEYDPADDVAASVLARLYDEAGYLDNGAVLTPDRVTVSVHTDGGKPVAYREQLRDCTA